MISVRAALDLVLRDLPRVGVEQIALSQALARVSAETIEATRDVPPFRNSAMDGYAVRAADIASAGPERPTALRILEVVGAGVMPTHAVASGTATKIMTGSPVPDGADAVVRIEDTDEQDGTVRVRAAVRPG